MTDRDRHPHMDAVHCPRCCGPAVKLRGPARLETGVVGYFASAEALRRMELAVKPLPSRQIMEAYGVSRATAKRDLAAVRRFLREKRAA